MEAMPLHMKAAEKQLSCESSREAALTKKHTMKWKQTKSIPKATQKQHKLDSSREAAFPEYKAVALRKQ